MAGFTPTFARHSEHKYKEAESGYTFNTNMQLAFFWNKATVMGVGRFSHPKAVPYEKTNIFPDLILSVENSLAN